MESFDTLSRLIASSVLLSHEFFRGAFRKTFPVALQGAIKHQSCVRSVLPPFWRAAQKASSFAGTTMRRFLARWRSVALDFDRVNDHGTAPLLKYHRLSCLKQGVVVAAAFARGRF